MCVLIYLLNLVADAISFQTDNDFLDSLICDDEIVDFHVDNPSEKKMPPNFAGVISQEQAVGILQQRQIMARDCPALICELTLPVVMAVLWYEYQQMMERGGNSISISSPWITATRTLLERQRHYRTSTGF